jgi:AraC-like DNA-binding protein
MAERICNVCFTPESGHSSARLDVRYGPATNIPWYINRSMKRGEFKIFRCGIAGVDAVESDTYHIFPRHTHEQFGIGVIQRGAQKSLSGRGMVEAGAGDVITVNPGEVHDGAPIGGVSRSWKMLYFDPSLLTEAMLDITEGKTRTYEFCRPVISDAAVAGRFLKLFSVCTKNGDGHAALQSEGLRLMLLPSLTWERNGFCVQRSVAKAIFVAKCLIDDSPASPITLSDLARASGMSRFQVLRGFVKATGLTPHAYLVQRRIDIARRLISRGAPLAEAATGSGFADQSYMTRIFARKYGISPGAYARAKG